MGCAFKEAWTLHSVPLIMTTLHRISLAAMAFGLGALSALAGDPTGTWKFQAEGPNGRNAEATLTLKWADNHLTGQIDNALGKAEITKATFADEQVSFTVVREIGRRLRKRTFTVSYSGKLEGDVIKGTVKTTGREDKPVSIPWEAKRGQ